MREARDFVHQLVLPTVYPEAIETIRWHQEQGHVVAIVSGATKFVVKPLAEALGIRHYLYTRLEVEHGRFTGRVIDPICFEEGKIYWLQQFIDERGDRSRQELVLHRLDHGPAADGPGRASGRGEPGPVPVPRGTPARLARAVLRATRRGGDQPVSFFAIASNADFGRAPVICSTTTPPLKARIVGIARTP